MKAFPGRGLILLVALSLSGCAAVRGGGGGDGDAIDLTRMHLGQALAQGQIAVEPADPADANNPEFASFAAAVERQLTRRGYTIAPARGSTEQFARLDVRQGTHGALTAGWPGVTPRRSNASMVATLLDVRIQRRSDGTVFWQGRAVSEAAAGSAGAQRGAAVERLAEALFRDFPGESGRTIRAR